MLNIFDWLKVLRYIDTCSDFEFLFCLDFNSLKFDKVSTAVLEILQADNFKRFTVKPYLQTIHLRFVPDIVIAHAGRLFYK